MKVIDQINGSALFAQSAYSATIATKDDLGRDITATYLTAINIPESATWNEVSQAYEQASATYLTSVSIPESATWQDVSTTVQSNSAQWAEGGGTGGDPEVNEFVYNNSATINEVNTSYQTNSGDFLTAAPADMATTGDVAELAQTVSETYQTKGDYLVRSDSANFYPSNNPSSFATEDWVTAQGYITGVDLSEYAKRDFVLSSIESATSDKLDVSSFASVSSDFLTTSFGISESAHWEEATNAYEQNSATYLTAHQDLSDYAKSSALNDYQTIAGMTAYQPAGSYATTNELEQVSADITATIPSTAGLASESYVQTNSAVLTGMIDGKQDTLTFGYDEQDRINSINSSALAGGGDVPEDVMVESAVGYNAVNEISGYNGSAIAQYGAEKQWLVHDDTLVHASNSAQYALGCNISALQRLMGIDETVLWEGVMSATGTTADFLDNIKDFERIKVYSRRAVNGVGRPFIINEFQPTFSPETRNAFVYNQVVNIESNTHQEDCMYMVLYGDTNKWTLTGGWRLNGVTQTTGVTSYLFKIEKIVGIHRISG